MEHLFLGKETEKTTHEVGEMLSAQATTRAVAPWVPVPPSTPMSEVIMLLTKVRRVPVIDPATSRVMKVVSQSLICHQMHESLSHLSEVPPRFMQRPKDFGLGMKNVVTVAEDTRAREAFQILIEKNVSAVGVLDEEGALLTCITAKDIRLLPLVDQDDAESANDHTTEELLNLTAVEFVSKARLVSEKRGKARPAVVVVHVDTPVSQMIAKLSKTGMHRLFLVDADHKPVGVFSVADAVRLLLE
jgi:CBS domain-containing protein